MDEGDMVEVDVATLELFLHESEAAEQEAGSVLQD